jgi:hypothetical protein
MKTVRRLDNPSAIDPSLVDAASFNHEVGAQKNMEMGHHLVPIPLSATSFTTNITALTPLPKKGLTLAIYNDAGSTASVVIGDASTTILAHGVADSSGRVGIPIASKTWTYIATYDKQFVIGNSANLFAYIVQDGTHIGTQN